MDIKTNETEVGAKSAIGERRRTLVWESEDEELPTPSEIVDGKTGHWTSVAVELEGAKYHLERLADLISGHTCTLLTPDEAPEDWEMVDFLNARYAAATSSIDRGLEALKTWETWTD